MNMQALMAQAKKIQKELEKSTKELEEKEFTFENENIIIVATGNNKIKNISIKNKNLYEDIDLLEEIIIVGINSTLEKIQKEKENKIGKYTNGLGGFF